MPTALPLDRMTTAEKLQTMEELWDDLCRNPQGAAVTGVAWSRLGLTRGTRSGAHG